MIGEQQDDGVVLVWARFQRIQNPAEAVIYEARARQVSLDGVIPLSVFHHPFVRWRDMMERRQIAGVPGEIFEIVLEYFRELDLVSRVEIEPRAS